MTASSQRFSSKFDKSEYNKFIPEKIRDYKTILLELEKYTEKNEEIFKTIKLNVDYVLILNQLVLSLGDIEKIAEKLDLEEKISVNQERIDEYRNELNGLTKNLNDFTQKLTDSLKWHLKHEEFEHNYKLRIEPIDEHIKIIREALNKYEEDIDQFIDLIMDLKIKRFT